MIIKTYSQFKEFFNNKFKKYHPDNKETGDKDMFMKYRQAYDHIIDSGQLDKVIPNIEIKITTTEAYNGISYDMANYGIFAIIRIPAGYYNDLKPLPYKNYKIYVKIIPEKDEEIKYEGVDADLTIIKKVNVNIFDILFGGEKELDIFGHKLYIKYTSKDVIKNNKRLHKCGYPKRKLEGNGDVIVKFIFNDITFEENDLQTLEKMRQKYGN